MSRGFLIPEDEACDGCTCCTFAQCPGACDNCPCLPPQTTPGTQPTEWTHPHG